MKSIMLEKNVKKKLLVICCLVGSLFINCVSTYVEGLENNDQDLNSEFPGDFYIDPKERFSIVIPKGWRIYRDEKSVIFIGLIAEYNIEVGGYLVILNAPLSISEIVNELFFEATTDNKLGRNLVDPQKGNISTTDLHIEYVKMLVDRNGRIAWVKIYYIPHRNVDSIMMITCTAIPDDNVDLDVVFDKFIYTFNWIK